MTRLFGTDGVRGRANGVLTAGLALDLSVAAARVLGDTGGGQTGHDRGLEELPGDAGVATHDGPGPVALELAGVAQHARRERDQPRQGGEPIHARRAHRLLVLADTAQEAAPRAADQQEDDDAGDLSLIHI